MDSLGDIRVPKRRPRLERAATLALAGIFAFASVAFADNLIVDGDGSAPVEANSVNMGEVCSAGSTTRPAAVALQATNHPGGWDVFAPGSTVTFTPTESPATLTGTSGSVVLPQNWANVPNGTMSPAAIVGVTVRGGPIGTWSSDWMAYTAAGRNAAGDPLSRTTWLNVRAAYVFCPDSAPPILNLPADMTVEAASPSGAAVTFVATATDANPASPTVSCSPASGSTFPLGTTTVRCAATDAAGNTANGSFRVTVSDTTAPSLTVPSDITVDASGPSGAVVTFSVSSSDVAPSSPDVTCSPSSGSTFAVGTTTVVCSATDAAGNTARRIFTVTVVDHGAPVVSVSVSPSVPNGEHGWYSAPVTVTVTATDNVAVASVRYELDGVSVAYGGPFSVGDGSHTVTATATDGSGNSTTSASVSFRVDTTAPSVSLGGAASVTALASATVTPGGLSCQTADTLSGVATSAVLVITGGTTNGVGSFTATCSGATDMAGNAAPPVSATFVSGYALGSGILPPLAPSSKKPLLVRGKSVPVKFRLPGDEGTPGGFDTTDWSVDAVQVNCSSTATATGVVAHDLPSTSNHDKFRFSGDRYIFNADLRRLERGTCWQIRVNLDDGNALLSRYFRLTGKRTDAPAETKDKGGHGKSADKKEPSRSRGDPDRS